MSTIPMLIASMPPEIILSGRLRISAKISDERIEMSMEDDGSGISDDKINSPFSLGLIGIRERIHRLGGSFSINNRTLGGTIIFLSVPLRGISV